MKKKIIETMIAIAHGEVGVREKGANRGRRVEEYQRADSLPGVGYAWCASFISWVIAQTARTLKAKIPWNPSASCDVILAWARKNNILYKTPQVGDLFLVMASRYDATHIGLVVEVNGNDFTTIEGNTNLSGGREGIGVFKRRRANSDRYRFVRPTDLIEEEVQRSETKPYTFDIGDGITRQTVMSGQRPLVGILDFARLLDLSLGWNDLLQIPIVDGVEVKTEVLMIGERGYAPLRDLAEAAGYALHIDPKMRHIKVFLAQTITKAA